MQVTIPSSDTTYWCAAFQIPQEVQNQERYIIRVRGYTISYCTADVCSLSVYILRVCICMPVYVGASVIVADIYVPAKNPYYAPT